MIACQRPLQLTFSFIVYGVCGCCSGVVLHCSWLCSLWISGLNWLLDHDSLYFSFENELWAFASILCVDTKSTTSHENFSRHRSWVEHNNKLKFNLNSLPFPPSPAWSVHSLASPKTANSQWLQKKLSNTMSKRILLFQIVSHQTPSDSICLSLLSKTTPWFQSPPCFLILARSKKNWDQILLLPSHTKLNTKSKCLTLQAQQRDHF